MVDVLDPKSSANKLIFKDSADKTNNTNDTKPETYPTTPMSKLA